MRDGVDEVSVHPESRLVVFARLVEEVEPKLRRALVAAYGPEGGREAAADALAWAWEHLERLSDVENVGGYLFRVGQSAARRTRRWRRFETLVDRPDGAQGTGASGRWDDELVAALAKLTSRQRVAVVLVHGYGYSYSLADAAAVLGCGVSSLRNHLDRGLRHVRRDLEGNHQ